MRKKRASVFFEIAEWTIILIGLTVLIYLMFHFYNGVPHKTNLCIESHGRCVNDKEDCIAGSEAAYKGMGCKGYCCVPIE